MAELYRLRGHGEKGYVDLILTETHIELQPSEEWLADMKGALTEGREEASKAPGVIGWIANKAVGWAGSFVEKFLAPHPLQEVETVLTGDKLGLKLGRLQANMGDLTVDPKEAYIFRGLLQQAKEKLTK